MAQSSAAYSLCQACRPEGMEALLMKKRLTICHRAHPTQPPNVGSPRLASRTARMEQDLEVMRRSEAEASEENQKQRRMLL